MIYENLSIITYTIEAIITIIYSKNFVILTEKMKVYFYHFKKLKAF